MRVIAWMQPSFLRARLCFFALVRVLLFFVATSSAASKTGRPLIGFRSLFVVRACTQQKLVKGVLQATLKFALLDALGLLAVTRWWEHFLDHSSVQVRRVSLLVLRAACALRGCCAARATQPAAPSSC